MKFRMTSDIFQTTQEFTQDTAPNWLTSCDTRVGSTMDMRWFWKDHVLTLAVGEATHTEFQRIERIE